MSGELCDCGHTSEQHTWGDKECGECSCTYFLAALDPETAELFSGGSSEFSEPAVGGYKAGCRYIIDDCTSHGLQCCRRELVEGTFVCETHAAFCWVCVKVDAEGKCIGPRTSQDGLPCPKCQRDMLRGKLAVEDPALFWAALSPEETERLLAARK